MSAALALPPGDWRAYIFDCDGTLADSMPLHYETWKRVLKPWGAVFPEKLFYDWAGRPATHIIADLAREQGLALPAEQIAHQREELYLELLPEIRPIPEVVAYVHEGAARGLPMAVVSGSPRESVQKTLRALGIENRFQALVCAGEIPRPKPAPDPFLRAAELLRVTPRHCVVFEDAELGIDGAHAAGMGTVRVPAPGERHPI